MNFEDLFGKSTSVGSKDGASNVSQKPKVNSPIMNVANLAFNQARGQDSGSNSNVGDKSPVVHSRTFSDTLSESLRGIRAFALEPTETSNQSDSSGSSSEETESSDSSITRVEQVKPRIKVSPVVGSEAGGVTKSVADGQEGDAKKSRAKVSSNMIISDFSNLKFSQKKQQGQHEQGLSVWSENFSEKRDNRSEVSRSSDPGRNNALRVKASENTIKTRQRRTNSISDESPRKVSFNSNSDVTLRPDVRSDVSWGSDPGQNTNSKKSILKSNTYDNQSHYGKTSYYNNNDEWSNTPSSHMPKAKASSLISYNHSLPHTQDNTQYRMNPRYDSKSPAGTRKTWSDVIYRPKNVSDQNDFGPCYQNPSRGDLKQHKPKVSMNAMMDMTNGYSPARVEELMSLSSDPKVQRKFLDLRISNKSLLSLNASLDATVKDQSLKLANLPTFESIASTQQQQLDHILKVEKLMDALTKKMSEQESEIKDLKEKLDQTTEENQTARVNLFYDPKMLPLNALPRLIFERVHDDITVFFAVITSLIYTIYVFPIVVMAKSAQTLAEKSRAKIHELSG
ncbi:11818_t:CDS:2 [Acaulospora morrowiae]|uniref:11818_t:CDS:1 n=1 Tax=Acaulospora morrowiae TaxID=94023 RepID=A0A9N9GBH3_9GLOM|nr:11818_t:CDS:2 [Acaulospora morrowiae]